MGIETVGLDTAIHGMLKGSGRLTLALGNELQKAVPASAVGQMRGRASSMGPMEGRAASGISIAPIAGGVEFKGGGDPFLHGSEFGGRRRPKKLHVVSSPRGRRYVVNKRTTMNFQPFNGTHGYFIFPVWRERLSGIRAKLGDRIVVEVTE